MLVYFWKSNVCTAVLKDPPGFSGEQQFWIHSFVFIWTFIFNNKKLGCAAFCVPVELTLVVFDLPVRCLEQVKSISPKWWVLHGDEFPWDRQDQKKRIPLKNKHKYLDEKGWSCPPPKLEQHLKIIRNKSTHRPCDLEDSGSSKKSSPIFVRKKSTELSFPQSDTLVMMPGKTSFPILGASKKRSACTQPCAQPQPPPWGANSEGKISHLEGMLNKVLQQDRCALREDHGGWNFWYIPIHAGCNRCYHQDWEISFFRARGSQTKHFFATGILGGGVSPKDTECMKQIIFTLWRRFPESEKKE